MFTNPAPEKKAVPVALCVFPTHSTNLWLRKNKSVIRSELLTRVRDAVEWQSTGPTGTKFDPQYHRRKKRTKGEGQCREMLRGLKQMIIDLDQLEQERKTFQYPLEIRVNFLAFN